MDATRITVEAAAGILGVTTGRVRQLRGSGDLTGGKFNRSAWAADREPVEARAKRQAEERARAKRRRRRQPA